MGPFVEFGLPLNSQVRNQSDYLPGFLPSELDVRTCTRTHTYTHAYICNRLGAIERQGLSDSLPVSYQVCTEAEDPVELRAYSYNTA